MLSKLPARNYFYIILVPSLIITFFGFAANIGRKTKTCRQLGEQKNIKGGKKMQKDYSFSGFNIKPHTYNVPEEVREMRNSTFCCDDKFSLPSGFYIKPRQGFFVLYYRGIEVDRFIKIESEKVNQSVQNYIKKALRRKGFFFE